MTISKILDELKLYIAKDKQNIFYKAIQDRLDKCLIEYYNSIRKAYDKLDLYSDKYELKLMKRLNKD